MNGGREGLFFWCLGAKDRAIALMIFGFPTHFNNTTHMFFALSPRLWWYCHQGRGFKDWRKMNLLEILVRAGTAPFEIILGAFVLLAAGITWGSALRDPKTRSWAIFGTIAVFVMYALATPISHPFFVTFNERYGGEIPHEVIENEEAFVAPQKTTDPVAVSVVGVLPIPQSATSSAVANAAEDESTGNDPEGFVEFQMIATGKSFSQIMSDSVFMALLVGVVLGLVANFLGWNGHDTKSVILRVALAIAGLLVAVMFGWATLTLVVAMGFVIGLSHDHVYHLHWLELVMLALVVVFALLVHATAVNTPGSESAAAYGYSFGPWFRVVTRLVPMILVGVLLWLFTRKFGYLFYLVCFAVYGGPALGVPMLATLDFVHHGHWQLAAAESAASLANLAIWGVLSVVFMLISNVVPDPAVKTA